MLYVSLMIMKDNKFRFDIIYLHSCILASLELICCDICSRSLLLIDNDESKAQSGLIKFVSSALRIALSLLLAICISFIQIIKSNGPRIDPCGTPVLIIELYVGCCAIKVNELLSPKYIALKPH